MQYNNENAYYLLRKHRYPQIVNKHFIKRTIKIISKTYTGTLNNIAKNILTIIKPQLTLKIIIENIHVKYLSSFLHHYKEITQQHIDRICIPDDIVTLSFDIRCELWKRFTLRYRQHDYYANAVVMENEIKDAIESNNFTIIETLANVHSLSRNLYITYIQSNYTSECMDDFIVGACTNTFHTPLYDDNEDINKFNIYFWECVKNIKYKCSLLHKLLDVVDSSRLDNLISDYDYGFLIELHTIANTVTFSDKIKCMCWDLIVNAPSNENVNPFSIPPGVHFNSKLEQCLNGKVNLPRISTLKYIIRYQHPIETVDRTIQQKKLTLNVSDFLYKDYARPTISILPWLEMFTTIESIHPNLLHKIIYEFKGETHKVYKFIWQLITEFVVTGVSKSKSVEYIYKMLCHFGMEWRRRYLKKHEIYMQYHALISICHSIFDSIVLDQFKSDTKERQNKIIKHFCIFLNRPKFNFKDLYNFKIAFANIYFIGMLITLPSTRSNMENLIVNIIPYDTFLIPLYHCKSDVNLSYVTLRLYDLLYGYCKPHIRDIKFILAIQNYILQQNKIRAFEDKDTNEIAIDNDYRTILEFRGDTLIKYIFVVFGLNLSISNKYHEMLFCLVSQFKQAPFTMSALMETVKIHRFGFMWDCFNHISDLYKLECEDVKLQIETLLGFIFKPASCISEDDLLNIELISIRFFERLAKKVNAHFNSIQLGGQGLDFFSAIDADYKHIVCYFKCEVYHLKCIIELKINYFRMKLLNNHKIDSYTQDELFKSIDYLSSKKILSYLRFVDLEYFKVNNVNSEIRNIIN